MIKKKNMGQRKKSIHWDVVGWICIGILMMGLPTIGILLAKSTLWNVMWWIVFICWVVFLIIKGPPISIHIFISVLLFTLYFEILPEGRIWAYGIAFIQTIVLGSAYLVHLETLGYGDGNDENP